MRRRRKRVDAEEPVTLQDHKETVYWGAGTARLLPRLLKPRTCGPVFVTHRKPGPGKVVTSVGDRLRGGWKYFRTFSAFLCRDFAIGNEQARPTLAGTHRCPVTTKPWRPP